MKETEYIKMSFTGRTIAKNTIYNLLGNGVPMLFALVLIPPLIRGLGTERFGILSLAWIVVGYFSFLDFGIGRALTKIISEKIILNKSEEVPVIFWTSFIIMLVISLIGAAIFVIITPILVYKFFNISQFLQTEALETFYVLAFSIPIVTTTAGVRGVIEAYQRFDTINIIKTALGVFSFLGPLLCLFFTNNLFWIVLFLVVIRIVIWVLYFMECFRLNGKIKNKLNFEFALIKPILKMSSWMTVSNVIAPVFVYFDRFLIGALVSASAITYYSTPYEIVTKLLIVPTALTGVLFPTFSASYLSNPRFASELSQKAIKFIFIFIYPVVLLIVTFAYEGMSFWLGRNFALNSSIILQLLAVGVLFNSIAYIPFSFLQGIGRPDITAKINIIELPFYLVAMWIAIKQEGINGAALVWCIRMVVDAAILFVYVRKITSSFNEYSFKFNQLIVLLFIVVSFFPVLISSLGFKIILISLLLLMFSFVTWKCFLSEEERLFLISRVKIFNS